MTRSRDVERLLDRWFADGPTEVADRVVADALSEIDHTRQRGADVVPWRYSEMPMPLRLLLVAALMVASAGAALLLTAGQRDAPPGPTPSPSELVRTGPGIPMGLAAEGSWVADRPAAFGSPAGRYYLGVPLRGTHLIATADGGPDILLGSLSGEGDGQTALGETQSCPSVGHYAHAISEDAITFTIEVVDDPCEDRARLLAGTWQRDWIDQELDHGERYRISTNGAVVDLTVPHSFTAAGGLTDFHGPAQPTWSGKFENAQFIFVLESDAPDGAAALDRCHPVDSHRFLPATLEEYLEWIRASRGLEVGEPAQVTVDGRPALRTDLFGATACQPFTGGILPTYLVAGLHRREWAIDLDGRLLLASVLDDNLPFEDLTPDMLATAEAFVASMEITLDP